MADDALCRVRLQCGLLQRCLLRRPPVILGVTAVAAETMIDVAYRPAPFDRAWRNFPRRGRVEIFHGHPVECRFFKH